MENYYVKPDELVVAYSELADLHNSAKEGHDNAIRRHQMGLPLEKFGCPFCDIAMDAFPPMEKAPEELMGLWEKLAQGIPFPVIAMWVHQDPPGLQHLLCKMLVLGIRVGRAQVMAEMIEGIK